MIKLRKKNMLGEHSFNTSCEGYNPARSLLADLQPWLVHTGDPRSRPRRLQTAPNRQTRRKLSMFIFVEGEPLRPLTCRVLSNQRLPLLEKVPPPCRTWAALRLAYLSIKTFLNAYSFKRDSKCLQNVISGSLAIANDGILHVAMVVK